MSLISQELLVEEVINIIRQEAIPLTFDGDVKFLNFSAFGRQGPTFISLVRDPLDPRIWQWYNYNFSILKTAYFFRRKREKCIKDARILH